MLHVMMGRKGFSAESGQKPRLSWEWFIFQRSFLLASRQRGLSWKLKRTLAWTVGPKGRHNFVRLTPGQNCLRLKAWEECQWSCEAGVYCLQGGFSTRLFLVCGVDVINRLAFAWPSTLRAATGPGRKSSDLEWGYLVLFDLTESFKLWVLGLPWWLTG